MLINRVGPPVRGADLFGRDRFVNLLWRRLEAGHVLLAAPRRFGKTSVMYRLIDEPRSGYKIVHADLEALDSPEDFLLEIVVQLSADSKIGRALEGIAGIPKRAWHGIRNAVDEVELFQTKLKLREHIAPDWQEIGRQVFKKIGQLDQPVLFILDELPMMIDRMARTENKREDAKTFLRWMRALRVSPDFKNVRFLIAGSIGIDAVLIEIGEISAINDFEKLKLEPFTNDVARNLLTELARSEEIALSEPCKDRMIELIGIQVPYFLQILFSEVYKAHQATDEPISVAGIDRIYRDKVLGVDCKTYFEHYYGRLRDYYSPQDERAVKRLLRELAKVGSMTPDACHALYRATIGGSANAESFNATLANLENDFYIRLNTETDQYEFACKLLRDWWLRHHGLEVR